MDYVDGVEARRLVAQQYPAGIRTDQVVRVITTVIECPP